MSYNKTLITFNVLTKRGFIIKLRIIANVKIIATDVFREIL